MLFYQKVIMRLGNLFWILSVTIPHVKCVINEGNCTQILASAGTVELHNITDALLDEFSTCFYTIERFRFIAIQNVTLKELLSYLPNGTTELYIRRSIIPRIWENAFMNFSDVKRIHLKNSGMKELDAKAFNSLPKLTELTLDENKIQTLNAKTFFGLPKLKSINLSFNSLIKIPSSVFYDLPSLQSVFLYNNRLKYIADDAFVNVATTAIMFKIHMQNNCLDELPYTLLAKVPVENYYEIKARHNNITEISDNIIHIKALAILNVGFNKIERVSKHLGEMPRLKYIYLNNNSLRTLPEEMLYALNHSNGFIDRIHLEGNPWKCDCQLKWMVMFIQSHNLTKDIDCDTPKHIKMRNFNTDDLQCNSGTVKDTLSAEVISGIVVICIFGICCVTTTVVCLWKTKVNKQQKSPMMVSNRFYYQSRPVEDSSGISVAPLIDNPLSDDGESLKLQIGYPEKALYGTLRLGKLLGRGAFGDVFEGFATGFSDTWKKVAVKKIKENATYIETESLVEEYQNLMEVGKHQNIIQVYGTGLINGSRVMVMELADNGDLLSYVRKLETNNRKVIQNLDRSEEKYYLTGKHPQLFMFMWQVAKGMEYLTKVKIVHRDLAARNILLTKERLAKISDFGLSRDVYETGYYFQESNGRLPYKWMSPETLTCGKYTTRSDVWSYGVLLWEVTTLGSSPYPGIPPNMLINMYNSGYIMPQPPLCPNSVYATMSRCWQHSPGRRPDFETLVKCLDEIVEDGAKDELLELVSKDVTLGNEKSYLDVTTIVSPENNV